MFFIYFFLFIYFYLRASFKCFVWSFGENVIEMLEKSFVIITAVVVVLWRCCFFASLLLFIIVVSWVIIDVDNNYAFEIFNVNDD